MPGSNKNNNENEKPHHLEGKKLKNLLKNSANDFSNMFKNAANTHGASMATRKEAANIQDAIDAARERIAKALAAAAGNHKGGGKRRTQKAQKTRRGTRRK